MEESNWLWMWGTAVLFVVYFAFVTLRIISRPPKGHEKLFGAP